VGLPAVGNTNFGLRYTGSSVGEATDVQQTTNISLKGLCIGTNGMTFGTGDGDACNNFDTLGGSNNSFGDPYDESGVDTTATILSAIGAAPYKMSELIGGTHEPGGGPGQ